MKRWPVMLVCAVTLAGLVVVPAWGEDPPPEYTPGEYGSTLACYPTCVLPNYIVAADFNQNGWLDLAVSCHGTSTVWTYANLGPNTPGAFACPNRSSPPGLPGVFSVGLGPVALIVGHIPNFNGYPDVGVLSQVAPGMFSLRPNYAAGAVPIPLQAPPALVNPVHVAGGDFDHTNLVLDFAVVDVPPLPAAPRILLYQDGAFYGFVKPPAAALAVPAGATPAFIVVADFDTNGWDDIAVVAADTNQLLVQYSAGPGFNAGAIAWAPYDVGFSPAAMDVGDFNADGFLDIVVVGNHNGNGYARVFLNSVNPSGFVGQGVTKTWGFNTRFVEVLDVDGNGRDDFVTANFGSHTLTVFLTWITCKEDDERHTRPECCLCKEQMKKDCIEFKKFKIELECGYYPTCLVGGDFDRNGKMDLAVTLYSATREICPQNPSCIEVIFDAACGIQEGQALHRIDPQLEPQSCEPCKEEPCAENAPPLTEIQTEDDSKNP